jgi:hypothetical protein
MKDTDAARALVAAMVARMRLYQENAEQCLEQLDGEQMWYRTQPRDNAVGNLILHITGNVDQVVNSIEGRPDVRDRLAEFSATAGRSKEDLSTTLHRSIDKCCRVMDSLPLERMAEPYRIQGEDTTIAYALIMAVSHFSLHLGQMQFIAKSLLQERYREALRRAPR